MTKHCDPKNLQFYITLPAPCPYLPGETERKIFTPLDPSDGPGLNDYLTHSGFRRSQNVIYRPACETCNACQSLRVNTRSFRLSKSFKRTKVRNRDLSRKITVPLATEEQFALLSKYLKTRHKGGGMCDMDFERFEMMVEDCASKTKIFEYRDITGTLVAACITDLMRDGLSMVYSFFDPSLSKRSLGKFMILDHIDACEFYGFDFLYLGYWVPGCLKMEYKSKFRPYQLLGPEGWSAPE